MCFIITLYIYLYTSEFGTIIHGYRQGSSIAVSLEELGNFAVKRGSTRVDVVLKVRTDAGVVGTRKLLLVLARVCSLDGFRTSVANSSVSSCIRVDVLFSPCNRMGKYKPLPCIRWGHIQNKGWFPSTEHTLRYQPRLYGYLTYSQSINRLPLVNVIHYYLHH